MYKIISSDLDETLLKDDKTVSLEDVKSIQNLKNCKFVVNTGRAFYSCQEILKQLGTFDKENEYTISFNGGIITENKNNRIIHKEGLSFEQIDKVFKLGIKLNTCMEIFTTNRFYCYKPFDNELKLISSFNVGYFSEPSIDFLKDEDFIKIMYVNEDTSILKKMREYVNLEDEYSISYSSNRYLEFNRKNVNKGAGLEKLCDLLNIDIQDTIAIGDNNNDFTMIKTAGLGVCVSNATEEIKKECDVIIHSDNNHNPMTELINRYIK